MVTIGTRRHWLNDRYWRKADIVPDVLRVGLFALITPRQAQGEEWEFSYGSLGRAGRTDGEKFVIVALDGLGSPSDSVAATPAHGGFF